MIGDYIVKIAVCLVPLLLGVVMHEAAHGWMAEKFGDPTARLQGRITLNPLAHVDPVGTLILPVLLILVHSTYLFAWAKPVPVQFQNLRGGRRGGAIVALAGPLTNFILAALSALVYHLLFSALKHGSIPQGTLVALAAEPVLIMARISVTINLVLMVINLLPIPPLDGGRVLAGLLPSELASHFDRLERYGMLIVLILIGTGLWEHIVQPVLSVLEGLLLH